ncbi:MAG TPA: hypothetical protein VFQ20_13425 [Burkholderiaceae bacterium]|nr:hypothetical protein [Burkholderiaceae bacterium]
MSGLTLRLREIETDLPTNEAGASIAPAEAAEAAEATTWHDSTLDLERGLEVHEFSVETIEPAPRADTSG